MPTCAKPLILYEDSFYIGFFKPAGVPTTYGAEKECFVEQVKALFPELFTFTGFKRCLSQNKLNKGWVVVDERIVCAPGATDEVVASLRRGEERGRKPRDAVEYAHHCSGGFVTSTKEGGLLYRLDNDACGLLLFAKNEEAFHRFNDDETLQKIYIVEIEPISKNSSPELKKFDELPQTGLLTFPIVHKSSKKMAALLPDKKIHYHGKPLPAETHYEKLNKRLVRCSIKKGVRHQIRLHMATAGAPLVGDTLYRGKPTETLHLCCTGILSKKMGLTPLQIDVKKELKTVVVWLATC